MTLTKENIEAIKKFGQLRNEIGGKTEPGFLEALCDLALLAVALKPRPIEEAKVDTPCLVIRKVCYSIATFDTKFGAWVNVIDGYPLGVVRQPTHFIPLSALSAMMEATAHD